jgi:hypothetical protein
MVLKRGHYGEKRRDGEEGDEEESKGQGHEEGVSVRQAEAFLFDPSRGDVFLRADYR